MFVCSSNAFADSVAYKERFSKDTTHRSFQNLYYPSDCELISETKDNPRRYIVRDKENLTTVERKFLFNKTGKTIRKYKDSVLNYGKKIYQDSGVESFVKGLFGN
jgi:hypothetical protein